MNLFIPELNGVTQTKQVTLVGFFSPSRISREKVMLGIINLMASALQLILKEWRR